jgi:hypothetical protein
MDGKISNMYLNFINLKMNIQVYGRNDSGKYLSYNYNLNK